MTKDPKGALDFINLNCLMRIREEGERDLYF